MKYRTIVVDPPWPIDAPFTEWGNGVDSIPKPYPSMTIETIEALPVRSFANNRDGDTHLYLWAVTNYLPEAFGVAKAWGFEPVATLIWCKPPRGVRLGGLFASNVEFILFCRLAGYLSIDKREPRPDIAAVTSEIKRLITEAGFTFSDVNGWVGSSDIASWWMTDLPMRCAIPKAEHWETLKEHVPSLTALDESVAGFNRQKGQCRRPPTPVANPVDTRWFEWPRGKHSQKPEAFIDLVEQVSPGPYLEMFARRQRLGWDTWGNECYETADTSVEGGL